MECRQKLESKLKREGEKERGGKGRVKEGRIGHTSAWKSCSLFLPCLNIETGGTRRLILLEMRGNGKTHIFTASTLLLYMLNRA